MSCHTVNRRLVNHQSHSSRPIYVSSSLFVYVLMTFDLRNGFVCKLRSPMVVILNVVIIEYCSVLLNFSRGTSLFCTEQSLFLGSRPLARATFALYILHAAQNLISNWQDTHRPRSTLQRSAVSTNSVSEEWGFNRAAPEDIQQLTSKLKVLCQNCCD